MDRAFRAIVAGITGFFRLQQAAGNFELCPSTPGYGRKECARTAQSSLPANQIAKTRELRFMTKGTGKVQEPLKGSEALSFEMAWPVLPQTPAGPSAAFARARASCESVFWRLAKSVLVRSVVSS